VKYLTFVSHDRFWSAAKTFISLALVISLLPQIQGIPWAQTREFRPDIRKTEEGIAYASVGVGYDSRVNLPRFPLMLVFATRNGRYLASIETEITPGPKGGPIRIHSVGPWLLVDLAPGKYSIRARTTKGQELKKAFEVTKGRTTRVNLIWNISDEEI
jgi:hypothetical protein